MFSIPWQSLSQVYLHNGIVFKEMQLTYCAILYLSEIKCFQENFKTSLECSSSVVDHPKTVWSNHIEMVNRTELSEVSFFYPIHEQTRVCLRKTVRKNRTCTCVFWGKWNGVKLPERASSFTSITVQYPPSSESMASVPPHVKVH